MKAIQQRRGWLAAGLVAVLLTASYGQVREIIKVIGVGAAVRQFGPEINRAFNSLTGHSDTNSRFSKVVPIISVGLNSRDAIGAAQVMGTKTQVQKVQAVASPEADLFGREIKIRALIPVDSIDITNPRDINGVQGVGVTGIVDLKL
ncbi:MAG: hypothetical protein KF812_04705 [Fimbriimonadaceae bacterium]|nr:hypothetical protein [Fimbriimonadaceae bacterium]